MKPTTRKETTRTLIFVGMALVSLGAAVAIEYRSRPKPLAEFEQIGEPFYADIDPRQARALRVVAYDEETASSRMFEVAYRDGVWRIPSHHDYPADAEERLARTAASIIGVERGHLVSRRASDHQRYGVIDPLDDSSSTLKGRGQRLTLLKDGDIELADLIIGKKVEGADDEYYVRRAGEDRVYRTKLTIDLSTKFADWIESDLLKLDRSNLIELKTARIETDAEGRLAGETVSRLSRKTSSDDWTLDGLDGTAEELKTDDINNMISALDDLKIVGVRPKPEHLTGDLKLRVPDELRSNPQVVQALVDSVIASLRSKGFTLFSDEDENLRIYSREGELIAATSEGVVYHLHFGNQFSGSELDIEIGTSNSTDQDEPETGKSAGERDANESGEGESAEKQDGKQDSRRSRYVFLRVEFDPRHLGDEPARPGKAAAPDQPAVAPRTADLDKYDRDRQEYERKIEEGEKKVQELNDRFAEWYYVISAEDFDNLRLTREQLVQPKGADEKSEAKDPSAGGLPAVDPLQNLSKPADTPEADTKK